MFVVGDVAVTHTEIIIDIATRAALIIFLWWLLFENKKLSKRNQKLTEAYTTLALQIMRAAREANERYGK